MTKNDVKFLLNETTENIFEPSYVSNVLGITTTLTETYVITNKSATGFTIEFFNSSDATVDRTFDYVVRGYGELAA